MDFARFAAVAQVVEHVIRNDGVVGSSPISSTIYSRKFFPAYKALGFNKTRGPLGGIRQVALRTVFSANSKSKFLTSFGCICTGSNFSTRT